MADLIKLTDFLSGLPYKPNIYFPTGISGNNFVIEPINYSDIKPICDMGYEMAENNYQN